MNDVYENLVFNDHEPIYLQLIRFFKERICSGALVDGESVPSRRALAARLGINPMTVQKAYRQMEADGFLVTGTNATSHIHLPEIKLNEIRTAMQQAQIRAFIESMRAMHMEMETVIGLVRTYWDVERDD